jgi:serine/threonine protein kinase
LLLNGHCLSEEWVDLVSVARDTVLLSMNLGKYETVSLIGQGGMSTVYRGRDALIRRDVAIKLLKTPTGTDNLDVATRFLSEARITALLQHPSIVTLFDFGTTPDNQTYIVMEFVEGRSLRHHLGKLTSEQFGKILRGVALGLDYAHAKGVVHRDVKPSNLLLTPTGDPKILDFGIAVLTGGSETANTQTGIVVGTPDYLAPEQVSGAAITASVDQFALAVVGFELLTGKRPFAGETMMETMTSILMHQPKDALALNPTLGSECVAVMERALSKRPQERFANCTEFAESLLTALSRNAGWQPFLAEPSPPTPGSSGKALDATAASAFMVSESAQTRTKLNLPVTVGLSVVAAGAAPTDYSFTQAVAAQGPFFVSGESHFQEVKSKLNFYQTQLQKEYDALIQQMRTTYLLWLVAVSMAFVVLLLGVVLFLLHQTTGGAVTTASSAMLYFLQRVFQQREDAYRKAAEAKRSTVEYGNQWALVIQTIQGMEDAKERVLRESRLVEALTDQLRGRAKAAAPGRGNRAAG